MKKLAIAFYLIVAFAAVGAQATVLTAEVNVDNGYVLYVSTDDSAAGASFGAGNNWGVTYTHNTTLAAGVDYFLHVYAYDQGGIGGFLGEFALSGGDHTFANGLTSLVTNTTYWQGNATGFSNPYGAASYLGDNGVSPWGFRPAVSADADWIWVGDAYNNDAVYFSTAISSVPAPAGVLLFGIGLVMLAVRRKRAFA